MTIRNKHIASINGRIRYAEQSLHWSLFLYCIISPLVFVIIRKLVPGQPSYIEASSIFVITVIGLWVIFRKSFIPNWILMPLLFWIVLQGIYVIPSIGFDPTVGVFAIGTRISPIFMALIAYATVKNNRDISKITYITGTFTLVSAFIAIFVVFFGYHSLPIILKPTANVERLEIFIHKGLFYSATSFFGNQTSLSYFAFTTLVFSLLTLSLKDKGSFRRNIVLILFVTSSFFIIFVNARRSILFISIFILISFLYSKRKFSYLLIFVPIFLLSVFLLDNYSPLMSKSIESRSGYIFQPDRRDMTFFESVEDRFQRIFYKNTKYHLEKSFWGTFLGSHGAEAINLGYFTWDKRNLHTFVETGSILLAAEMGIIGLIAMPLVIIVIFIRILIKSKYSPFKQPIRLLLIVFMLLFINYYTKNQNILTTNQTQVYLFWAIPGLCASFIRNGKIKIRQRICTR